jgi:hypothetical protein
MDVFLAYKENGQRNDPEEDIRKFQSIDHDWFGDLCRCHGGLVFTILSDIRKSIVILKIASASNFTRKKKSASKLL